jgi:hypothetical protein
MYFIKQKWEANDKFVLYKFLVENQIKKRIKILWIDNGGKYKLNVSIYIAKNMVLIDN